MRLLNNLNKFSELWKAKGRPFEVRHFSSYFHWTDVQPNFFNPSLWDFIFMPQSQSQKQTWLQIYVSVVYAWWQQTFQYVTQLYILSKTSQIFMCFNSFCLPSPRENEISQTVRTFGSHIYSRNVYSHRLWHDIPRFVMHLLETNILLTKHWKCEVCLHFWLFLCETGRHSVKLFFLFNRWLSIRSFDRRVVASWYFTRGFTSVRPAASTSMPSVRTQGWG